MSLSLKSNIVAELHKDILRLEGFKSTSSIRCDGVLGVMCQAFPNGVFPLGCVHEFTTSKTVDFASTCGFLAGVLSSLMETHGAIVWISASRKLFPPALRYFGIEPERFIFLDLQNEKDILWTMDEALKCRALTAVVCEIKDISFTTSRRLQLAVERSHVTGFILRSHAHKLGTTACVSRWRITSRGSFPIDDLPGIGNPTWCVELLRIRNGKPGLWNVQWKDGKFISIETSTPISIDTTKRKTG